MRTWCSAFLIAAAALTQAQPPPMTPPAPAVRDPDIDRIVAEISPQAIEATVRTLVGFQTRHTLSDSNDPKQGIGAARNWIQAEFERMSQESGGRLQVELDRFTQRPSPPRIPRHTEVVNVVATLPGRQAESKDRIYVVSAHYDSRATAPNDADSAAPGADDDASGVAAMLELARVMSKRDFDATIVFMAVAAEEQGLQGARHWAENARDRKRDIAGMITNDIVGSPVAADGTVSRNVVRLFAEGVPPQKNLPEADLTQIKTGGENDFPPRQLARAIRGAAELYVPHMTVRVVYRRDRYLRGGDHAAFLDAGFPAVRFTEPSENYAHQHQDVRVEDGVQYGDLPEFVDFAYLADVARVNAAALATLARAPASPDNVEVETARLENDTELSWSANREPDLAGYRIVWRETTAPFWEQAVDVGVVTKYIVKGLSKDDVVFGVEAVDTAGHASPAVYPKPYRPR